MDGGSAAIAGRKLRPVEERGWRLGEHAHACSPAIEGEDGEAGLLRDTRRRARRLGSRRQEGVSTAGDEASSRSQSGQPGGGGALQGSQGSLRGPVRQGQARGL